MLVLWASGAPSMLYPVYLDRYGVNETVTTALFATYPAVLVVTLTLVGSLSDSLGRRPLLLAGVSLITVGAGVFLLVDALWGTFLGRVLQGVGAGAVMGAASALLLESVRSIDTQRAAAVSSVASASGTSVSLLVGGWSVSNSPWATTLPFALLLVFATLMLVAVGLLPRSGPRPPPQRQDRKDRHDPQPKRAQWRPNSMRLPQRHRAPFLIGTFTFTVAFIVGAVFVGLGAQVLRDVVRLDEAAVAGAVLAAWSIAGVPAAIVGRKLPPHTAAVAGAALVAAGCVAMLVASENSSPIGFLTATVLCGGGYGLMFVAGLGLVMYSASPSSRAGNLSLMYLVGYFGQGLAAVVLGITSTVVGLGLAVRIGMPAIGVLAIVAGLAASRRRVRIL